MKLSAEVGDVGRSSFLHSTYVEDGRPLAPPPIHVAIPVEEVEDGDEESEEEYMGDSANSDSFDGGDLDLDAMHDSTLYSNTGEEDYNLNGGVKFWVGHMFKYRDAVLQDVKNYSIRRSAEYRVIESDRLKYHVQCHQAGNGCQWSLHDTLRQNLGYWEVRRVGGTHSCLALTMFQGHQQLDSSLICKIYEDWEESYNKVPKLLQAQQSYFPGTICELRARPYYDGHLLVRDYSMLDKVFWAFPSCVETFKHCKPFVSVDGTHLYGRYGRVLLIAVAQDGNSNILSIAFAIVESESIESWSFFLTNLRRHVTPQDGQLVISNRSQAIKAALSADDRLTVVGIPRERSMLTVSDTWRRTS
nr:uncharacterized protein LOC112790547 [Arachis hypogaea]